jgi:hypothetical protein
MKQMSVNYTGIKLDSLNAEVFIGTDLDENGKGFYVGVATPPPERPGDEPMMLPLVHFFQNEKGKLTSARCLLEGNKRMRILQKVEQSANPLQGMTLKRIEDQEEASLAKAHVEAMAKLGNLSANVFETVVGLMAKAEALGVRYYVRENERNKNALMLEMYLDGNSDPERSPIVAGAWELDNIKSQLDVLQRQREEEIRREEIKKQALAKLTPEERMALGYKS